MMKMKAAGLNALQTWVEIFCEWLLSVDFNQLIYKDSIFVQKVFNTYKRTKLSAEMPKVKQQYLAEKIFIIKSSSFNKL